MGWVVCFYAQPHLPESPASKATILLYITQFSVSEISIRLPVSVEIQNMHFDFNSYTMCKEIR